MTKILWGVRNKRNAPETPEKSKYEIVEELTKQGKSCKEIVEITGFKNSLVSQYRYKIKQRDGDVFPSGHNADREKCKTCQYRAGSSNSKSGCDYIEHTGRSRGCSVADCDKYEKGDRLILKETFSLLGDE